MGEYQAVGFQFTVPPFVAEAHEVERAEGRVGAAGLGQKIRSFSQGDFGGEFFVRRVECKEERGTPFEKSGSFLL